jgi:hypothetical protein
MVVILQITAFLVPIYAEEAGTSLSEWAKVEVTTAIEKNLVPDVLQTDYQGSMKRYEYVLLALEILDIKQVQTRIIRYLPFNDTYNHPYSDEIVLAYNAGIIQGDGKGKFRPDETISREEIAILLSNLISQLKNTEVRSDVSTYSYSDDALLHDWARSSVNYCYSQGIIIGTGTKDGLPIVSPANNTSREQAVIMMLRVSDVLDLFKTFDYPSLKLEDELTGDRTDSDGLNVIAKTMGESMADLILETSTHSDFKLYELDAEVIDFALQNSRISIKKDKTQTNIIYRTRDLSDEVGNQLLKSIGNLFYGDDIDTPLNRAYMDLPILEQASMSLGVTEYAELEFSLYSHDDYNYQIQIFESFE